MALRIDTLLISKRLTDGGFTRDQADVLSATWNEAIDMAVKDLATREDIAALRRDDIAALRFELQRVSEKLAAEQKAAIAEAINRQMVWTIGAMLAVVGVVVAILRLS